MKLKNLQRLFRPRSIAVVGGEPARRCIRQCDLFGYQGEIWPVNPNRKKMELRSCLNSIVDLPAVPDAVFIAVPNRQTIDTVRYLKSIGAGGAVCYASGFAEIGEVGRKLQKQLQAAMGDMPLIGPNCYGMLNYLDGIALWPDVHGGKRCDKGVAIISQSGNITVSLSMQRRAVPVAYLISTGNMAGLQIHHYIYAMLENPNVTAIGLYLEGLPNVEEFSHAALAALKKNIPIVALVGGKSEKGAAVALSHSNSMSGSKKVLSTFFEKFGIIEVSSIPQLLETLKFVSVLSTHQSRSIASISCSGGEAALIADLADKHNLVLPKFSPQQQHSLYQTLGDRVHISNPLDYHTYIWGDQAAQQACFQSVFSGEQAVTIKILDFPSPGICDVAEWEYTIEPIIKGKEQTDARVAVVSTLHENFPLKIQEKLLRHGIAPMMGLEECVRAIAKSAEFADSQKQNSNIKPIGKSSPNRQEVKNLSEYHGKQILKEIGIPTVDGYLVRNKSEALLIAKELKFPVVAKISSDEVLHKSELNGVRLSIRTDSELKSAVSDLFKQSENVLIENMAKAPYAELLVGVRKDPIFGFVMVIGAGGKLAELIDDSRIILHPFEENEIRAGLDQLKIGKVLKGYRNSSGDVDAAVEAIMLLASLVEQTASQFEEVEINPLFVYETGKGVLAIDVLYRKSAEYEQIN